MSLLLWYLFSSCLAYMIKHVKLKRDEYIRNIERSDSSEFVTESALSMFPVKRLIMNRRHHVINSV